MASESKIDTTIAILCSSYRAKNDDLMAKFLVMVRKLLSEYPDAVLEQLVNPKTGIMVECSFFPSIAELKKFCEKAWDRHDPRVTYDRAPLALPNPDRQAQIERVRAMAQAFRLEATGKLDDRHVDPAERRAEAERQLDRIARELREKGLTISDEARRLIERSPYAP
jgi:hypothetical protein